MTQQEQHSHSRDTYDLVVIGGGPAGEKGAAQAAYFGKRVAIVERARIGGAVTNTGTLPSKTLQATAAHIAEMRDRDELDMEFRLNEDITVDDLFRRQREVVRAHLGVVNQNIRRHNIDLIDGAAVVRDPGTVEVTCTGGPPRVLSARHILIATGSRPSKPEEIPFDGEYVYDSDSILQMRRIPRSMIVVGAGAIGCEYASLFAAVGVRVTLVDSRERLLPFIDHELTAVLEAQMRARGVNVLYRQRVVGVEVHAAEDRVEVLLKDGYTLSGESLLFVAGRTANTDGIGLAEAGVAVGSHGTIAVDDHYRTSLPGVYAAGDVIGFPALASTSMEQARVAVCHAFGFDYKRQVSSLIPYGLFTIPPISTVGASEEDLDHQRRAVSRRPHCVPYERARADPRRCDRAREAAVLAARPASAWRRHRRRGRERTHPPRAGVHVFRGDDRLLHRQRVQLPDAVRCLQVRRVRRSGQTPGRLDVSLAQRRQELGVAAGAC